MARDVSIRELRNSTASVVAELEVGERLTLTVSRRPVADIVPHTEDRDNAAVATQDADFSTFEDVTVIRV